METAQAMRQRWSALTFRRIAWAAGILLACGFLRGVGAQDSENSEDCAEVTVSGLSEADGFPSASMVYTNVEEESERGQYVSDDESYYIWYCPEEPLKYTSETPDAEDSSCTGYWLLSSYPVGDAFNDTVWYQILERPNCQTTTDELIEAEWVMATRSGDDAVLESADVQFACVDEDDDGSGGVSDRDVVVILIIVGVAFMACMCFGALICCCRGKNQHEEAIMPPGELGEGSVIGAKAEELKPGLHAHPEVEGQQHPRPEDWAPSYSSSRSAIPTGSRSGPSVRSIGYQ